MRWYRQSNSRDPAILFVLMNEAILIFALKNRKKTQKYKKDIFLKNTKIFYLKNAKKYIFLKNTKKNIFLRN
jgi:hypothetical protein